MIGLKVFRGEICALCSSHWQDHISREKLILVSLVRLVLIVSDFPKLGLTDLMGGQALHIEEPFFFAGQVCWTVTVK